MVDSCYDKNTYNLVVFKGLDSFGHSIILFISISPKDDYSNFLSCVEFYKMCGFNQAPRLLIIDSLGDKIQAFEKCGLKPTSIQVCQNYVAKIFKKNVRQEGKLKSYQIKKSLKTLRACINIEDPNEFALKFNELYLSKKDESEAFKKSI